MKLSLLIHITENRVSFKTEEWTRKRMCEHTYTHRNPLKMTEFRGKGKLLLRNNKTIVFYVKTKIESLSLGFT